MDKQIKVTLTRNIFGFNDPEVLGPVNLIVTDDIHRILVTDSSPGYEQLVYVAELKYSKTSRARLLALAKVAGFRKFDVVQEKTFGPDYCGSFNRG